MFERIVVIGYLTRDAEMRYTPGGTAVTNFTIATKQKSKAEECPNGWKEAYGGGAGWELTKWWKITTWGKLAEVVNEYTVKGSLVRVEGVMKGEADSGVEKPRMWERGDGTFDTTWEVTARRVLFLTKPRAGDDSQRPPEVEEDEIPF